VVRALPIEEINWAIHNIVNARLLNTENMDEELLLWGITYLLQAISNHWG
jgi:hypothetical protein